MNITRMQAALAILHKYEFNERDGNLQAEHDEIFIGGPNRDDVAGVDINALEDLGFRWDSDLDCWHAHI